MLTHRGTRVAVGTVAAAVTIAMSACSSGTPSASPTISRAPDRTAGTASAAMGPASAEPSTGSADPTTTGTARTRPTSRQRPASTVTPAAPPTCRTLAGRMSLNQRIGQLFMVGTNSAGMPAAEAATLSRLHVGSVLLLGNTKAGRDAVGRVTAHIRRNVSSQHGARVLLAADQEGGLVQRLAGPGFDTVPSAVQQAKLSDSVLRQRATRWARQLDKAGIDVNLAPVSDVVPTWIGRANQPIGALDRGYGSDPQVVAAKNTAFIRGMHAGHVGATVKHFPGLGVVRGNTDLVAHVTDTHTTRHSSRLAGFTAGVRVGVDEVMMSSAVYTRIDADHPAAFSRIIVRDMLRGDLGFRGVIISDDLLGKALGGVSQSKRALRFIRTGGDLAIVGDPSAITPMVHAVRDAAAGNPKLRSKIVDASTRVLRMKHRYGLVDCTG